MTIGSTKSQLLFLRILVDVSDIFYFFSPGEGKGEFEAPGGGGFGFLLKIPGGGGAQECAI